MSITGTHIGTFNCGGLSFGTSVSRTDENALSISVSLDAGEAGVIVSAAATLTGASTMTVPDTTLTAGSTVDVYWAGGLAWGCSVDNVASATVTLLGGNGDALPESPTAIVVCRQTEVACAVDFDDVALAGVVCAQRAHIDFQDASNNSLDVGGESDGLELGTAREAWVWASSNGIARPITGNAITHLHVSNGSTTACTLQGAFLFNGV